MTATFFSLVFGLLLMAVLFPRPALVDLKLASLRGWMVVSMSGLASAFGVTSFYLSLDRVSVVIASPVAGANPLVAILMTHIFLQRLERVSRRTVIGAVLVVAGVALVDCRHGLARTKRSENHMPPSQRGHSKPSPSPKGSTRRLSSVWDVNPTSWNSGSSGRCGASTARTSTPSPFSEPSPTRARACW